MAQSLNTLYYGYDQLSKAWQMFGHQGFSMKLVLLSPATSSVTSGNFLAFNQ